MTVHPSLAIVGSYAASLLHEISNRDVATARCSELLASEPGGSLHICFFICLDFLCLLSRETLLTPDSKN